MFLAGNKMCVQKNRLSNNTFIVAIFFFLTTVWCLAKSVFLFDVIYLLLALVILMLGSILLLFKNIIREDIFSPLFVSIVALMLMYGLGGIYLYENLTGFYKSFVSKEGPYIVYALLLVILMIFSFVFGLLISLKPHFPYIKVFSGDISFVKLKLMTVLMLFAGLALFYVLITSLGYSSLTQLLKNVKEFAILTSKQGQYYFKFMYRFATRAPFFLCLCFYYKYYGRFRRNRKFQVFLLFYLLLILCLGLVSGSRSQVVYPLLSCLFVMNCLKKKISVFSLGTMLAIITPFVLIYGIYRNLPGHFGNTLSLQQQIVISAKAISLPALTRAFITRFNSAFENLIKLLSFEDKTFLWGESFYNFLCQPIPRVVFPDKPQLFNMAMTKKLFPDFFATGSGTCFGLIPEAFMNVHVLGVITFGIVYGFIIGFMQRLYIINRSHLYFVFFYSYLITAPWGWLAGGLVNSIMNVVLLLVIFSCTGLYFLVLRRPPFLKDY
jgi:oligosaccharide repeat unit polymerase